MAATILLAEIDDDKTYTQFSLAERHNRSPEWAVDEFVFPTDVDGAPVPGVPHCKRGTFYYMEGIAIRLWLAEQARPGLRKTPDSKKRSRSHAKKANNPGGHGID